MANPFPARFDSNCNSCGEPMYEGDNTFAVDGSFVCKDCATANDNVCECGNFKKNGFDKCYVCYQQDINPEPPVNLNEPPF